MSSLKSIPLSEVDDRELVQSLRGLTCPACGDKKGSRKSMCRTCFFKLPKSGRDALWQRLGNGYEEAMEAAIRHLGRDGFILLRHTMTREEM